MTETRLIPCEHCDGSGRELRESGEFSRFDGAMIVHDCGPCPVCHGTLVEEIEVEPITEGATLHFTAPPPRCRVPDGGAS